MQQNQGCNLRHRPIWRRRLPGCLCRRGELPCLFIVINAVPPHHHLQRKAVRAISECLTLNTSVPSHEGRSNEHSPSRAKLTLCVKRRRAAEGMTPACPTEQHREIDQGVMVRCWPQINRGDSAGKEDRQAGEDMPKYLGKSLKGKACQC